MNKKYHQDLIHLINTEQHPGRKCRKGSYLNKLLYSETSFLTENNEIYARLWYVKSNIFEQVKCPNCGKPTSISKKFEIRCCSVKCLTEHRKKIDPETGLSIHQLAGLKVKEKRKKIDPDTGLTSYQSGALKGAKTMAKIDPETGLTKSQDIGIKVKQKRTKFDPETGLTSYQSGARKGAKTMAKIDPETGLSKSQQIARKSAKTMSIIDPETGLSKSQQIGIKTKQINSKIDPKTGLSGYQLASLKAKETLSKIDPKTGLTSYQLAGLKAKETNYKIDPETGLTGYQLAGIKSKETLSKIDPETGLTGYQLKGIKSKETVKSKFYDDVVVNRFGNDYKLLTTKDQYVKSDDGLLNYSCNKCGSIRHSHLGYIRCITCYPYTRSIGENEVLEYCQSLTDNAISNSRQIIPPLEIDIHLPEFNLAIEYNGLYWHSSDSLETENKDYHLNKTELCHDKSIQLLHIFENEWHDPRKQKIWKSIISNKLGRSERIYGRKTEVIRITSKDKTRFLIDNHLQGDCASRMNLGLIFEDRLVSVMTFGKSRYDKSMDFELLRFCNLLNTTVVGGAGKLLSYFRNHYAGSIISYADKRRSTGGLYEALGFELSHESRPNYWYVKGMVLESRIKYQKHKLEGILDIYDGDMTESENMYMNGYRKIYDCGNQVWKMV